MSKARLGVIPWNKGIVFTKMIGNKNAYRGDKRQLAARHWEARKVYGKRKSCERCSKKDVPFNLVIHHKDRNTWNNTRENLELLCRTCHINEHRGELQAGKTKTL